MTGNLEPFSDSYLRAPVISLSGVPCATLNFQGRRNVDPDPPFHGTIVKVLDADTLVVLQAISTASAATDGYQLCLITLPQQFFRPDASDRSAGPFQRRTEIPGGAGSPTGADCVPGISAFCTRTGPATASKIRR